jgi:hypothetical protein
MAFSDLVEQVDRAAMAALGGEPVIYRPSVEAAVTITGIFDSQYELAEGTANAGVEALGPAVFFRLEDLPVAPEDDDPTLEIRGIVYRVVERRPDDQGGIVLVLRIVA